MLHRSLSDLPEAPLTGNLPQEAFHSSYLTPLLDKAAPVIVVFLQDKLHIKDISKYADVYNPDSDGGAFKNIKGHLKEDFSLELPHVEDPHLAVDTLRQNFPGTVLDLSPTSDLSDLGLRDKKLSLVVVCLHPVADAPVEEAAITANDELIGKISRHLERHSIKYTALYTAEMSHTKQSEKHARRLHGRHLLEALQEKEGGYFYNLSYAKDRLYAYLTSVSVCIRPPFDPDEPALTSCSFNFTILNLTHSDMDVNWVDANKTLSLTLTINDIQLFNSTRIYNLTFIMPFQRQLDRWEILQSVVSLVNTTHDTVKDFGLVTQGYDAMVPLHYSFHCSSMKWYPLNMSSPALAYIILGGFQVQPFNTPSSGFYLPQDCVGWFTRAIWMGLVTVGLNILILALGMYMLTSLTTNSRYDNPKNKPLTFIADE
ncbi:hypothetical protein ACOMHN_060664 [Nucella lapillus]